MENRELKPCPFCGGVAVLEYFKSRKGYEATIQCNGECVLYMSTITHDTEKEAIEAVTTAWNRRAENER
jgi:Lar family restriction alleviation protein